MSDSHVQEALPGQLRTPAWSFTKGKIGAFLLTAALLLANSPLTSGEEPAQHHRSSKARPASAMSEKDRHVAALRHLLISSGGPDGLPQPPRELGVHTACKKFGRGCSNAYVAFLEAAVAAVESPTAAMDATDNVSAPAHPTTPLLIDNGDSAVEASATTAVVAVRTEPKSMEPSGTFHQSKLRLPISSELPYNDVQRLEGLHRYLAVMEKRLLDEGVTVGQVQAYLVPSASDVELITGGRCDAPLLSAWQQHPIWTAFHSKRAPLSLPGHRPWRCRLVAMQTYLLQLLPPINSLLSILWLWTLYIAIPSAAIVRVVLWVAGGERWTEEVLGFVLMPLEDTADRSATLDGRDSDALCKAANAAAPVDERNANSSSDCSDAAALGCKAVNPRSHVSDASTGGEADETDAAGLCSGRMGVVEPSLKSTVGGGAPLSHADALLTRHQLEQVEVAQFALLEDAVTQRPVLFFLKLRLVLCTLVAVQLLWSIGTTLAASIWPHGGGSSENGWRKMSLYSSIAALASFVLPTWFIASGSLYISLSFMGSVLIMAVQGVLDAHTELLMYGQQSAMRQSGILSSVT